MDSLDRSSVLEVGLEAEEILDRGLSSSFALSEPVPRLFSERLVSGGLGGRSPLREDAVR